MGSTVIIINIYLFYFVAVVVADAVSIHGGGDFSIAYKAYGERFDERFPNCALKKKIIVEIIIILIYLKALLILRLCFLSKTAMVDFFHSAQCQRQRLVSSECSLLPLTSS